VASAAAVLAATVTSAQGVREHTRLTPDRSAVVTESQAAELTLTLTDVAVRPIQAWVRTAGVADASRRMLTARVSPAEGALVRVGQRVRAFAPTSRSLMYQAKVSKVTSRGGEVLITADVSGRAREDGTRYVLEIVTEYGEFLSVPNEAIIETGETGETGATGATGGARIVYVQQSEGRYAPRAVRTGLQGELYTQVLEGVQQGERVVTLGSFFVDAERKLKGL
jgi:hypothetical protein